ncbi:MAG TPA: NlpC/P60 family protein [Acidimicrobiales bacterium]|nr:NlpC/P60 family protein [Acidimicrobiales bacterium]
MSNKASARLRRNPTRRTRSALRLVPVAVTLASPGLLATPAWADTTGATTTTVAPTGSTLTTTSTDTTATSTGTTATTTDPTATTVPTTVAVTSPPSPTSDTTAPAGSATGGTTGSTSGTTTPTTTPPGPASTPTTIPPASTTAVPPTSPAGPAASLPAKTTPVATTVPPKRPGAPKASPTSDGPKAGPVKNPPPVAWAAPAGDSQTGELPKIQPAPTPAQSGPTATTPVDGYWVVTANGGVFTHGNLAFYGSAKAGTPGGDTVALVPTTDGKGYWMASAKGQVQAYGDAVDFGSAKPGWLNSPVRALVPTADGLGYWLVTGTGGVFAFGDASFYGAIPPGGQPVRDIVAAAATPDGGGYWLVGEDGLVYPFGDARSSGDGEPPILRSSVVGLAVTSDGQGYWMATANGGVFSFGDARFYGSQPSSGADPVVSITPTSDGGGYWIATASGKVTAYGDATALPNPKADPYTSAVVGLAVPRTGPLLDIPMAYIAADRQAAATCPGMPWTVLAAIGKVESDFGRTTLPGVRSGANFAGAAGPMQMGIGGAAGPTFYAYDHPVPADMAPNPSTGANPPSPYNLSDAVFAATRDLCSNGAGNPATLREAVLSYNHSNAYADEVLSLSSMYGGNGKDGSAAVRMAMTQLGVPYLWGGTTPNVGLDCSGLVQWAYRSVGVDLPRTSQEQWLAVPHLPASAPLQPGDLLFFGPADGPTHVGMYVGGSLMIDAPHTGAVVRIEPYDWNDYLGAARP